jgi:hypothetical protein
MRHWTRSALLRYNISDFFSSLLSAYHTSVGDKLWVITEADRSSTCILLPEEY